MPAEDPTTEGWPGAAGTRQAPAGWYPNPNEPGRLRWWDGTRWAYGSGPAGAPLSTKAPAKKRGRALPVMLGVVAAVALAGGGALVGLAIGGGDDDEAASGADSSTTAVEETTVTEESASPVELEELEDDTGALRIRIPGAWADRDLLPLQDGVPDILAAANIDDFYTSYDTSGLEFSAFRAGTPGALTFFDPASRVGMQDMLWFVSRFAADRPDIPDNACGGVDREQFERADFEGLMDTYVDCGESGSTFVAVAAANADETVGISLAVVLTDPGERASLDDILDSVVAQIAG